MESTDLRRLIEDQLALARRLRERIAELEAATRAPLAIVGTGLRLPGGLDGPEAYWRFLLGEGSAEREIPAERTGLRAVYDPDSGREDRSHVGRAAFLEDVAGFDAGFFGISHREAEALDPQQRLLLETVWEAFERAGLPVRRRDRLDAGVFVGLMSSEYGERLAGSETGVDPYYGTGAGHCFAAGRIGYALGLRGPALSVDTACSSSLVALHLAAQSLRRGECRYAVVAGANLLFSPDLMVSLCRSGALSPDGRCKPFAANADGYGRGEGVGALILMRLDDARREGRPVLAVVRGTAVNHDGASSGLTVPNGPAQQEVIRDALRDAGIEPAEVDYVEAHGTGTSLGDPIEVGALDAVLGSGAPGRTEPLLVGSVKARIGHLEAASGIAGVIKLVLALRHGVIPTGTPESEGELNPYIPWDRVRVQVPRATRPWPATARRIAGVSAYGLSGTNAHILLEAADPRDAQTRPNALPGNASGAAEEQRPELLTLSAKSPAALRELIEAVQLRLLAPEQGGGPGYVSDLCHTLRAGRAVFKHRLAVVGGSPVDLAAALVRVRGERQAVPAPRSVAFAAASGDPRLARAVAELRASFPQLATDANQSPDGVDQPVDAADWLFGALRALGVPATRATGELPRGALATLAWRETPLTLVPDDPADAVRTLLEAVAALYDVGAALKLELLAAPGARLLADAPTYPFQRQRYWIDEPVPGTAALPAAENPAPPRLTTTGAELTVSGALRFLTEELACVLKIGGELDLSESFFGLGGDSFTAMLLMKGIEQAYDVGEIADHFDGDAPLAEALPGLAEHIVREAEALRTEGVAVA